jgi:hypothetical protein
MGRHLVLLLVEPLQQQGQGLVGRAGDQTDSCANDCAPLT